MTAISGAGGAPRSILSIVSERAGAGPDRSSVPSMIPKTGDDTNPCITVRFCPDSWSQVHPLPDPSVEVYEMIENPDPSKGSAGSSIKTSVRRTVIGPE